MVVDNRMVWMKTDGNDFHGLGGWSGCRRIFLRWSVLLATLVLLAGCANPFVTGEETPHTVREKIEHTVHAELTIDRLPQLNFTDYLPLHAPAVLDAQTAVYVLKRTDKLNSYPCSSCHLKPLEQLQAESTAQEQQAHWEITLDHAGEDVMGCTTCHNTASNVDELHTLNGMGVAFDASYLVCAQCHSTQFDDWLGGAHGKQIGGWTPPRVMAGCANCHSPHNPQWEQRFPAYPMAERKGE